MTPRTLKLGLRLFVSLAILGLLIWKIGPSAITVNLLRFKPASLVLMNVTTLAGFILAGIGLIILGRSISTTLSWMEGMKGFLATASLSIFIPGRVGDLALLYYWKQFMSREESLAVVVIDKLITLSWVGLVSAFGLCAIFKSVVGAVVVTCLVLCGVFLLAFVFTRERFRRSFPCTTRWRILSHLQGALAAVSFIFNGNRQALLITAVISGSRILIFGFGFWVSLWGLDVEYPFLHSIFMMSLAQLTSILPISVMGLGTVEAICVYGLSQMQIESSITLSALLAGRLITIFWMSVFFCLFCLTRRAPRSPSLEQESPSIEA